MILSWAFVKNEGCYMLEIENSVLNLIKLIYSENADGLHANKLYSAFVKPSTDQSIRDIYAQIAEIFTARKIQNKLADRSIKTLLCNFDPANPIHVQKLKICYDLYISYPTKSEQEIEIAYKSLIDTVAPTPRIIETSNDGPWIYCKDENHADISSYKLHVALKVNEFDRYNSEIYKLLEQGVKEGVIPAFKMLAESHVKESATHLEEMRLKNNPFTIYLFADNTNLSKVAELCRELDEILHQAMDYNHCHTHRIEVPLLPHITLRQENYRGQYVPVAMICDWQEDVIEEMRTDALTSEVYKILSDELMVTVSSAITML